MMMVAIRKILAADLPETMEIWKIEQWGKEDQTHQRKNNSSKIYDRSNESDYQWLCLKRFLKICSYV